MAKKRPNEPNLRAAVERRIARFWPNEPNFRAEIE